jgi:hypothetical protein
LYERRKVARSGGRRPRGLLPVCGLRPAESLRGIEPEGTWFLDSAYGDDYDETWVISDSSISYYSGSTLQWTGTVVSYDNDAFNASETGSGNYGYAAICYTYALNTGWGESGKYNIFRWEDFTGSACDFTVGYKDATGSGDSDYTNDVADTAAEGISDITAANCISPVGVRMPSPVEA